MKFEHHSSQLCNRINWIIAKAALAAKSMSIGVEGQNNPKVKSLQNYFNANKLPNLSIFLFESNEFLEEQLHV